MKKKDKENLAFAIFVIIALLLIILELSSPPQNEDGSQSISQGKKGIITKMSEDVNTINECLSQYLPGFVFWGDSLTARGMPNDFERILHNSVLEDLNEALRHTKGLENYKIEVPVVNMGVGSETSAMIVARSGAEPYLIANKFLIPSDKSPVAITIIMNDGSEAPSQIKFRRAGTGMESVIIAGVEGIIERDQENNYNFRRMEPGEEVMVAEGTEIVTEGSIKYKDYIPVIYMGTNGGYNDDPQELIRQQQAMIDSSLGPDGRFIIVGIHTGDAIGRKELETAMEDYWEDHYVNLREYFSDIDLHEYNIIAVEDDINQQNIGACPPSLLENDGLHFTNKGYEIVAQLIFDRMCELGYFDELCDAVVNVTE